MAIESVEIKDHKDFSALETYNPQSGTLHRVLDKDVIYLAFGGEFYVVTGMAESKGELTKDTIADLQENGGAIGGTNDGDLPDIGTVSDPPTQAEVQAIRDAVRELAARSNEIATVLREHGLAD